LKNTKDIAPQIENQMSGQKISRAEGRRRKGSRRRRGKKLTHVADKRSANREPTQKKRGHGVVNKRGDRGGKGRETGNEKGGSAEENLDRKSSCKEFTCEAVAAASRKKTDLPRSGPQKEDRLEKDARGNGGAGRERSPRKTCSRMTRT